MFTSKILKMTKIILTMCLFIGLLLQAYHKNSVGQVRAEQKVSVTGQMSPIKKFIKTWAPKKPRKKLSKTQTVTSVNKTSNVASPTTAVPAYTSEISTFVVKPETEKKDSSISIVEPETQKKECPISFVKLETPFGIALRQVKSDIPTMRTQGASQFGQIKG